MRVEPEHDVPSAAENPSVRRLRLGIMTTVGLTIDHLYHDRFEYLQEQGFDITVICNAGPYADSIRARGVELIDVPMQRAIRPWSDARLILRLWGLLKRARLDILEVSTPKGALLGSLAGRLAGVPALVHILRGLVYEGKAGLTARLVRLAAWVPCRIADVTFSVSPALRDKAIADGLGTAEKVQVLGHGSFKGIDTTRYNPDCRAAGRAVRQKYDIPDDALVLGFIGRMTRDKGLHELTQAFRELRGEQPNLMLLLVGDYDERDQPPAELRAYLADEPNVRHVGWQEDVVPFLGAMDVLVLPTYREGFCNVVVEAGASGLPTVTTSTTGCRDTSVPGETGYQVPVGDADAVRDAVRELIRDPELRRRMGVAGHAWVHAHFGRGAVWQRFADEYRRRAQEGRGRRG